MNLCSYQIPAGDVTRFALDADLPSTADGTIQRKVLALTLHPAPCTLHPAPCTLNPAP